MKPVYVVLSILVLMFQYRIWLGDSNVMSLNNLKQVAAEQQRENDSLRIRNKALIAEVYDLKNGQESYEELARLELGMIGKNETFVQIIPPKS